MLLHFATPRFLLLLLLLLLFPFLFQQRIVSAMGGAVCFQPAVSCLDPSRQICSSDSPSYERQFDIDLGSGRTCPDAMAVSLCSWTCGRDSSCLGFNSLPRLDSASVLCQFFASSPHTFGHAGDCAFYTMANGNVDCFTVAPATTLPAPVWQWIVIQRRNTDNNAFDQNWKNFRDGFGDAKTGNFWLGLGKVNTMTSGLSFRIRFTGVTQSGITLVDEYSTFTLGDESSGFIISASGYVGYNADLLNFAVGGLLTAKMNGAKFSTSDVDNELNLLENCAKTHAGGWWYHGKCDSTNFNGLYTKYFNQLNSASALVALKSSVIEIKRNY